MAITIAQIVEVPDFMMVLEATQLVHLSYGILSICASV
jgi:hypothetical protein